MELLRYVSAAPDRTLAADDTGACIRYGDVAAAGAVLGEAAGRCLVFLLCENTLGTVLSYLSCLYAGVVPLLLDARISADQLRRLVRTYQPAFLLAPRRRAGSLGLGKPLTELLDIMLSPTGEPSPMLHPELVLLLTTSGSTGSPRLVRLSRRNLDANAGSIARYLELDQDQRPITVLPMAYSYGMSIINSHALVGASIQVTDCGVLEGRFWDRLRRDRITSLSGVPYTYQMFLRVGLTEQELPDLETLTQAGGKLPLDAHRRLAGWAEETGRRFIVMYGQTEASPRMSYLPPERSLEKCGSIGIPIPGGRFHLEDEAGAVLHGTGQTGELVYCGENVAMGYASGGADLALGDLWQGVLHTGDMARRDEDGFYYITGRKKRFIKLLGNRINLDELEQLLNSRFPQTGFACIGGDDRLLIFTDRDDPELRRAAAVYLAGQTRLKADCFPVRSLAQLPRNDAGKLRYEELQALAREQAWDP